MITNAALGVTLSLFISLIAALLAGRFEAGWWALAFLIGTAVSLIIGFFVPIRPLSGFLCKKLKLKKKTVGGRLVGVIVSDVIYSAVIVSVLSVFAVNISSMRVESEKNDIASRLTALQAEIKEDKKGVGLLSEQLDIFEKKDDAAAVAKLNDGINTLNAAIAEKEKSMDEMNKSLEEAVPPSFAFVFWISLVLSLAVGFAVFYFMRPVYAKLAKKIVPD